MNDEEREKHERTKKKLKTIGTVLLVIGIVCEIAGFLDMAVTINGMTGFPSLFFLNFLGAPCIFVGVVLLVFSCRKEIMTYTKNEVVPVVNDTAEELKPAIKSVIGAVREGIKGDEPAREAAPEKKGTICPKCGSQNQPENKFCDRCGTQLYKVCPACGARQDGDDVFCGECGARL
ncbi:MAG: zinc-ribbon domain-containing protein [Clostridia bacterium]|nr:zinc-ribbon domain-containing protein [Clostridia bacterium]